jgi:hypothetical protein
VSTKEDPVPKKQTGATTDKKPTCVRYCVFSGIMVIWNVSLEFVSRKLGSAAPHVLRIALASSIMMSIAFGFLLMKPKRSMYSLRIWWLVLDDV